MNKESQMSVKWTPNEVEAAAADAKFKIADKKAKDDEVVKGCLAAMACLMLAPVIVVLSVIWDGFILFKLWHWFLIGLGLPTITIMQAFGISLTTKMFVKGLKVSKSMLKKKEDKRSLTENLQETGKLVVLQFAAGGLYLLMGYIIHLFC
jgi:hypothetical protein